VRIGYDFRKVIVVFTAADISNVDPLAIVWTSNCIVLPILPRRLSLSPRAIWEMFIPANVSIVALNKIQKLKQLGRSLMSYVAEFCSLVVVANVKESHVLIHMFNLGLNDDLVRAIHLMGEIPTNFDKYITAITKIDSNINHGKTTIALTNTNQYRHYRSQPKSQKKDDDTMDVDRLNEEECTDCMAKGLCFVCKKRSYRANSCPEKKKKKVPVRQEKIEEEDDETENCRLAEDF
jgi:hypothetical protein